MNREIGHYVFEEILKFNLKNKAQLLYPIYKNFMNTLVIEYSSFHINT
jgi:hypothetical protein